MKKEIFKNIQYFTILIVLLVGTNVLAYDQTSPPANPPANDVVEPLYTTGDQVKGGGLGVVQFGASKNAAFNLDAIFTGFLIGRPGSSVNDSTLYFGGNSSSGMKTVNVAVNGFTATEKSFSADNISGNVGFTELCAEQDGTIVWCGPPTPPPGFQPRVYNIQVYTGAIIGGTVNDTVFCSAGIDIPARQGGETVEIRYNYGFGGGNNLTNTCMLNIPEGAVTQETSSPLGANVTTSNACVVSSSAIIQPGIAC